MGGYVAGSNFDINSLIRTAPTGAEALKQYQAQVKNEILQLFPNFNGSVNAAQMKAILNLDSVKKNIAAFVNDVVVGDSGIQFTPDAGAMAAMSNSLGKAGGPASTAAYVSLRDLATGFESNKPNSVPADPALFETLEASFRAGLKGEDFKMPATKPAGAR